MKSTGGRSQRRCFRRAWVTTSHGHVAQRERDARVVDEHGDDDAASEAGHDRVDEAVDLEVQRAKAMSTSWRCSDRSGLATYERHVFRVRILDGGMVNAVEE